MCLCHKDAHIILHALQRNLWCDLYRCLCDLTKPNRSSQLSKKPTKRPTNNTESEQPTRKHSHTHVQSNNHYRILHHATRTRIQTRMRARVLATPHGVTSSAPTTHKHLHTLSPKHAQTCCLLSFRRNSSPSRKRCTRPSRSRDSALMASSAST